MPGHVEDSADRSQTGLPQQIDVMAIGKDGDEEHISEVLHQSVQTAWEDEQAHLMDALMRSKGDAPLTSDGIVLMRLKRVGRINDIVAALLESVHLHAPIGRVIETGCEVRPAWTPAILLVPLTEAQVLELGVELSVHHIIAHMSDKDLILAALKALPSRQRPSVSMPPSSSQVSPPPAEGLPNTGILTVEVERTFLSCRIPKDVSEASGVACTAPCGDASAPQPVNPRRWGTRHSRAQAI